MPKPPRHLKQLEQELLALREEAMLLEELDCFIAGLLVCPDLIKPSEWLPLEDLAKAAGAKVAGAVRNSVVFRRGSLFLVNIGVPVVIGVAVGKLQPTLVAAVLGMLLSFADNDAALPGRLRLLLFDAAIDAVAAQNRTPIEETSAA